MDRTYDIFEVLKDGDLIWRFAVVGLEEAVRHLKDLASKTGNEVRVMHLPTSSLIARLNVPFDSP